MPRVREITMDGLTCRISPLSFDEADVFIKESRELIKREPPAEGDEWTQRTVKYVCLALNKATPGADWTPEKVTSEMDGVMILNLFTEFMKMSGVMTDTKPGEEKATSTSR